MTFLELVQSLHRRSGEGGVTPTTVEGELTHEVGRLKDWIRSADLQIQELWHDWKFLWANDYSHTTEAGVAVVEAPANVANWDFKTFRADGQFLVVQEYADIRGENFVSDENYRGQPYRIIVRPDNALQFDPVPDKGYVITADYYRKPTTLENNADVSRVPSRYHEIILGLALQFYGSYENAEDSMELGKKIVEDRLRGLESDQRPKSRENSLSSDGYFQVVAR